MTPARHNPRAARDFPITPFWATDIARARARPPQIAMPITRCGSAVACGRSPPWPPAARPGGHGRRAASTWCNAAATVGWLVAVVFVCMPTVGVVAATGDVRQRLRRRAQDQPLDEQSWSNLRRFVCGSVENVKCMNDER